MITLSFLYSFSFFASFENTLVKKLTSILKVVIIFIERINQMSKSNIEYIFSVPESGTYQLLIRCHKRLEGESGDKCNDGWVKMAGDFTSGNDVPTEDLKSDEKFFGGSAVQWGWAEKLDWQGTARVLNFLP